MKDLAARLIGSLVGLFGAFSMEAATVRHANPVLLVHGILDSATSMQAMGDWLNREGWEVHRVSLVPSDGSRSLEDLAGQVDAYINKTFSRSQKIDLVGFSMGGIVCRYYLQCLGGAGRVERFVQISSPNHGTWTAWLSNHPGCVQMRPNSRFLTNLNSDLSELEKVQFITIRTPLDLMIVPASSSVMPVGRHVHCWVLLHPLMILQPSVFRVAGEALAAK